MGRINVTSRIFEGALAPNQLMAAAFQLERVVLDGRRKDFSVLMRIPVRTALRNPKSELNSEKKIPPRNTGSSYFH